MIETLWLQVGPYLGFLTTTTGRDDLLGVDLSSHAVLIEAIERRDAVAARAALVADLADANDVYRPFTQTSAATVVARKPVARTATRRPRVATAI